MWDNYKPTYKLEKCDCCGDVFSLFDVVLAENGKELYCRNCASEALYEEHH